jgi:outer membrane protein OmpA-like peptidoglycan-associated protein
MKKHQFRKKKHGYAQKAPKIIAKSHMMENKFYNPFWKAQTIIGNHGVLNNFGNEIIQPKSKISSPNDKCEKEADKVAEIITRMPETILPRQIEEEKEEEQIQLKPITEITSSLILRQIENEEEELIKTKKRSIKPKNITTDPKAIIRNIPGSGQPLTGSARFFFENRLGQDFSRVRVHIDSVTTKAIDAKAFTIGNDIVFDKGQYAPEDFEGKKLLAHELTHIVQNNNNKFQSLRSNKHSNKDLDPSISKSEKLDNQIRRKVGTKQTPEIQWEKNNRKGRVEKVSANHYILWNFGVGRSKLKSEFQKTLDEIIKRWPVLNIANTGEVIIEGHASSSAGSKYNRRLAWRRAVAVKSYLWNPDVNIPWERMVINTYGESTPWFPNSSPAAMARNRRVEIKLKATYSPTHVIEEPPKETKKPAKKENLLKDVWLGIGESHSGDLFVIGAHSAASIVFNLGDEWPNIRWAAVNVSGYKFGPGLGGSVGAAFILVNKVSSVSEFTSLTPGGFDFDASLGAKLKGWLSSLKGVSKVIKTLDDYKKLKYVGEQAIKNRDLAQKGLHAFAVPMAGAGLHLWLGYKFGEVQVIDHGILGS